MRNVVSKVFVLHSPACATLRGEPGATPDSVCDALEALAQRPEELLPRPFKNGGGDRWEIQA